MGAFIKATYLAIKKLLKALTIKKLSLYLAIKKLLNAEYCRSDSFKE